MQQHFKQMVENALFSAGIGYKNFTFSQFVLSPTKTMVCKYATSLFYALYFVILWDCTSGFHLKGLSLEDLFPGETTI